MALKPEISLELPLFAWRPLVQLCELGPPALSVNRLRGSAHPSAPRPALPGFGAVNMVIFVPPGDAGDRKQPPQFYDSTFQLLTEVGMKEV